MANEVGFIGTGNIGNPMARKLVEAGYGVLVFDRREDAAASVLAAGASFAKSARDVAQQCRIVFTSLPDPAAVDAVVTAPDGLLAGARAGEAGGAGHGEGARRRVLLRLQRIGGQGVL